MVVFAVLASALCCAVWTAAVIRFTRGPAGRLTASPGVERPREEDRVRPAVDAAGQPIWVEADELFWHEIVSWPPRHGHEATKRSTA